MRRSIKSGNPFTIWEDECDKTDGLDKLVQVTGYELATVKKLERLASLSRHVFHPELNATSQTFQDYCRFALKEEQEYHEILAYADILIERYYQILQQMLRDRQLFRGDRRATKSQVGPAKKAGRLHSPHPGHYLV